MELSWFRSGRPLAAAALVAVAVMVAPSPTGVSACSSDHPTFREAVQGARAIARVTIMEALDNDETTPPRETFKVERILKGSLPPIVAIAPPWTSLCHDSAAYQAGGPGRTIILAVDVRYYDDVIHPMWTFDAAGQAVGSAGSPSGVTTLAGLEVAILAALGMPDTSTDPPKPTTSEIPAIFALSFGLIAFAGSLVCMHTRNRGRAASW